VDINDTVNGKDILAMSCDLNAILSREGIRNNPNPYNNRKGRLIGIPHLNWVPETHTLHWTCGVQIVNHGRTDHGLPNLLERVQAIGTTLVEGVDGSHWLDPDIGTRASNQKGLSGYA
jgi:hypothetical protein